MGAQDTTDAFFELLNADDRAGALKLMDERIEMRVHVAESVQLLKGHERVGGWFLRADKGLRIIGLSQVYPFNSWDSARDAEVRALIDIAKAAGTSPAAILYWFEGKDGLLREALRLREQEFHDRYTVRAETQPTASATLRVLIEAMLYHYDWSLWLELCVLATRDAAAAAERDRMDRRWRAALRSVIQEALDTLFGAF